jgi:Sulfotransferase family
MTVSTRKSNEDTTESTGTYVVPGRVGRVLLLGVARSGTRWLATALGNTEGTRLVKEPDNVTAHDFGPYPVIDPDTAALHYRALWDLAFSARVPSGEAPGWGLRAGRAALRLPRGVRDPLLHRSAQVIAAWPGRAQGVVVKSIYAQFAVEWLLRNYRPKVIVIQRHPLNVVSSWLELGVHGFDLLSRPIMRERFLDRLGIPQPPPNASQTHLTATWVGLLTTALAEHVERHPEWLLVTHEELCEEPEASIHRVCTRLGLTWTGDVARFLADSNRPGEGFSNVRVTREQSSRWRKRLTESQITEIEAVLAQFPHRGWVREPGAVPSAGAPL